MPVLLAITFPPPTTMAPAPNNEPHVGAIAAAASHYYVRSPPALWSSKATSRSGAEPR
jgi:hypothetical protein